MMEEFDKTTEGKNFIAKEDFMRVVCDNGLSEELGAAWFRAFDTDDNDEIDFKEYVLLLASKSQSDVRTKADRKCAIVQFMRRNITWLRIL
eukprot:TRINITY_DN8232_c0_g1_i1.p1 TRINITY_DN8232_c0_g1~~TRINITY_DN8232_c0_g1_i1.p1  ORF type:complete len:91 (-),score=12.56 TRINITY_DN8232_c0_g1_i1:163-435(-)